MNLKELRKAKGITQTELAERLGIKRTTVSMWEMNASSPTARMIPALAAALGCSIDALFRPEPGREPEERTQESAGEG